MALILALPIISYASIYTNCKQNLANETSSCGGLSGGTYSVTNNSTMGYLNINYTKPLYVTQSANKWNIKFGGSGTNGTLTIPSDCINQPILSLKTETYGYSGNNTFYCLNSTTWKSLYSTSPGGSSRTIEANTTNIHYMYDKSASTYAAFTGNGTHGFWTTTYAQAAIYEEDITWNISTANINITIETPTGDTSTANQSINFTVHSNEAVTGCVLQNNTVNYTLTSCNNITLILASGANTIKIFANDTYNKTNVTTITKNLIAAPTITIQSPANTTYQNLSINMTSPQNQSYSQYQPINFTTSNSFSSFTFNFTPTGASHCWVINSTGNNISLPTCSNFTFTENEQSTKSITACTNNTAGDTACTNINFTTSSTPAACWYKVDAYDNTSIPSCQMISQFINGTGQHNITLYINQTNDIQNQSQTINFIYSGITINALDEDTLDPLQNITAVIINGTGAFVNTSLFNYTTTIGMQTLPLGEVKIGVTYNGIITRSYTATLNSTSNINFTAYIPTNNVFNYTFQTVLQTLPLSDVLITIERAYPQYFILQEYKTVSSSKTTDLQGAITVMAKPNQYYRITLYKDGYITNLSTLPQTLGTNNFVYQIQMIPVNASQVPQYDINTQIPQNITISLTPESTFTNTTTNVTLNIYDLLDQIGTLTYNITYLNYTNMTQYIHYFYSTSSPGINTTIITNLNNSGRYFVNITFNIGSTIYQITRTYVVSSTGSIFNVNDLEKAGGPSNLFWKMLALFVLVGLSMILIRFVGALLLLIMPFIIIVMSYFGIFTLLETILIILITLAMIRLTVR